MKTVLLIIQIPLALLYLAGGAYKIFAPADLASQIPALSPGAWIALGIIELLGGILLIVPTAMSRMPMLPAIAAGVLALEGLVLSVIYAQYSTEVALTNPLVWSVVMTLLMGFVAYARLRSASSYALTER